MATERRAYMGEATNTSQTLIGRGHMENTKLPFYLFVISLKTLFTAKTAATAANDRMISE
jgi:hypothetical protein